MNHTHIRHSALQLISDGHVFYTHGAWSNAPMTSVPGGESQGVKAALAEFLRSGDARVTSRTYRHAESGRDVPKLELTGGGRSRLTAWTAEHGRAG